MERIYDSYMFVPVLEWLWILFHYEYSILRKQWCILQGQNTLSISLLTLIPNLNLTLTTNLKLMKIVYYDIYDWNMTLVNAVENVYYCAVYEKFPLYPFFCMDDILSQGSKIISFLSFLL